MEFPQSINNWRNASFERELVLNYVKDTIHQFPPGKYCYKCNIGLHTQTAETSLKDQSVEREEGL